MVSTLVSAFENTTSSATPGPPKNAVPVGPLGGAVGDQLVGSFQSAGPGVGAAQVASAACPAVAPRQIPANSTATPRRNVCAFEDTPSPHDAYSGTRRP